MTRYRPLQAILCLALLAPAARAARAAEYFAIQVVDEQTGRGVPLVELKTVNEVRHVTDSNGLIAFHEPGLMDGAEVFFHVASHGYEHQKDGFGFRGVRLKPTPGGEATVKIKRLNIAERLYRVTGAGIYRDTVLLGRTPPTSRPVLNGQVFGQDSVMTAIYQGKMLWFWGDTGRPGYPLGNFHMSGAILRPPADPDTGINLDYFADETGFSRGMFPVSEPGPIWIDALMVLPDETGRERLVCRYLRIKPPFGHHEQGLGIFNDEKQIFQRWQTLPLDADVVPRGHPIRVTDGGVDYFYFNHPFPSVRVRADLASIRDLSKYESFTCLKPGAKLDKANPQLDRDARGKLIYAWKANTALVGSADQVDLEKANHLSPDERWWQLKDLATGGRVLPHGGSIYWNDYRKKWIAIFVQSGGSSFVGEVWFAEADKPEGPWAACRKIVTHDNYSFYNPKHHPEFDRDGGRIIYFEGTYTAAFTDNKNPTPRYDYNQILYRLDLSDPRLRLETR